MVPPSIAARYRETGVWTPETLPGRLTSVCEREGGRLAIVDASGRLTFADAQTMIERVAGALFLLGVGPGDVVSWQLPNWWEAAVVHHAALRLGALPNPLNMIFRERELGFVLAEAKPKVTIVPASFRGVDHAAIATGLGGLAGEVVVARGSAPGCASLDEWLAQPAWAPAHDASPSDLALLLYTSGTTSDPKGVLHTHETLLYEIRSLQRVHAIFPEDRYLGGSPVTHIAGLVYGVLMPFALGSSTVMLERWEAAAAIEAVERDHATFMTGAPVFLQSLAERAFGVLPGFRLFSTGGASIDTEMVRAAEAKLGCTVKRAYGSTEVPTLTATAFDDPPEIRLGADGRPIGPAELRIRRDGEWCPPGVEGEITARSPETFVGYRNPALDAFDAEGWFATGDLGVVSEDGVLRVTGRIKDIIIRGGENISAAEVEALIVRHPAVEEVAVVGFPDARLGERACAFIVPASGHAVPTLDDIVSFMREHGVAPQKLPERLEARSSLPRTASGKIAKADLRAQLLAP